MASLQVDLLIRSVTQLHPQPAWAARAVKGCFILLPPTHSPLTIASHPASEGAWELLGGVHTVLFRNASTEDRIIVADYLTVVRTIL